ncbi:hypothetical protein PoB_003230200 [Plakobranchus ocellatus]|uniref:Uncharacterized protein n=1 Tax=Plakobranchus ocellatus TaxID=259542 RepID=A0AAV4AEX7_9GAST|nr:hypothetical protein PoB_003230200 [Plakobranchus ocellatus]
MVKTTKQPKLRSGTPLTGKHFNEIMIIHNIVTSSFQASGKLVHPRRQARASDRKGQSEFNASLLSTVPLTRGTVREGRIHVDQMKLIRMRSMRSVAGTVDSESALRLQGLSGAGLSPSRGPMA